MESASRWLVGSSRSRVSLPREKDSRQLDPPALPAGERYQWLRQDPILESQARRDGRCLRLGRVATAAAKSTSSRAYCDMASSRTVSSSLAIRSSARAATTHDLVESTGRQDAVAGQHLEVPGARVLGQVADGAGPGHRPRGRVCLPRQHLGQGRLARAVASDEPDPVARRRCGSWRPRAGGGPRTQLDPGGDDHGRFLPRAAIRQRPGYPTILPASAACSGPIRTTRR